VEFLTDNVPDFGILFDHDVSQPLIARKERSAIESSTIAEFTDAYRAAQQEAWLGQEIAERIVWLLRRAG
jgi:hypothetical protein